MLKLVRHLLFLGALLGLSGNGVASASPACSAMMQDQSAAMSGMAECDAAVPCPDCESNDSKSMKPGCMMMTGCIVALAIKEPAPLPASLMVVGATGFWPVTVVLAGRIVAPEPEPPTLLG